MMTTAIPLWEPTIASDGLTLDTPLGDVDLVAIDRARRGIPVELTDAELTWLAILMGPMAKPKPEDVDARRLIGEALGLEPTAVTVEFTRLLKRVEA